MTCLVAYTASCILQWTYFADVPDLAAATTFLVVAICSSVGGTAHVGMMARLSAIGADSAEDEEIAIGGMMAKLAASKAASVLFDRSFSFRIVSSNLSGPRFGG